MTASPKMDDDEGWALGPEGDKDVLAYINKTPSLLSLLYDLNLLPEQHPDHESEPWERIFTITNHWRENELSALESRSEVLEDSGDWQCRDFGDGWITFPDRKDAEKYQKDTGAMVRYVKYFSAISPRAEPGAPDFNTESNTHADKIAERFDAEREPDHAAEQDDTQSARDSRPASAAPDCGHTFDGKAIRPCPICTSKINPARGEE